ncbi:hypothetical protein EAH76_07605 [Sphingomonas glacialis]|uniref:Uncharacterized protein n=2 Tax=Sphingomonas glacialis TaxID=658225 RepID=A0A502FYF2_9SPHN|nr:hypothetical protein EAH76_07605 [Sphingomonas glacialis]
MLATALLAVSACAKHDDAANTAIVNETDLNATALDANSGTVDGFGNDSLASNGSAPLDAADNGSNAL